MGTIQIILTTISIISAIIGGVLLILNYRKSNKIKAAEIFYNLENNFKSHIPILLDIEYEKDYKEKIAKAINAIETKTTIDEDDEVIEKLDSMLRHFHTCYFIKKLKVDDGMLDDAYKYYLKYFIDENRIELKNYIKKYWNRISIWANQPND